MEIDNDWAENIFVIKANLMHERVHSGEHDYSTKTKKVVSSLAVYNDDLDIYGLVDCVEFIKDNNGVFINELNDNFKIKVVEYKPRQPKKGIFLETDAIQVYAQKLCIDYIFHCDSEAYIFYADVRKRISLPFTERVNEYRKHLMNYLEDMRNYLSSHTIPAIKKGQKCSGCSLIDICMPKCGQVDVRKQIASLMEDV